MSDNFININFPVVTVSVLTYNSSKFVLETLESIKVQTYPNIILQICDDCSTDNTVGVCKKWIEDNKNRFVKTKIIVPEHNTGISGNANRSFDACETEYYKGIAGDDLLLPNCIEDNMNYVKEHPEAVFVFSRVKAFGTTEERIQYTENELFIYDFFNWTPEQQYNQLYNKRNCLPAPSVFSNICKIREIGLRHDERIPLFEDYPMWINALRLGITFHFLNKTTVSYRVHNNSLSSVSSMTVSYYNSVRLFSFLYIYPNRLKLDYENTIKEIVNHEIYLYRTICTQREEMDRLVKSYKFKIGFIILYPFIIIKNKCFRRKNKEK